MISSSFEMICYIVMGSCMYLTSLFNSKFSKLNMIFGYMTFWIQQDHGINISKLLMDTSLEVCEGHYIKMWF
jgi:hypothetical protein